MMRARLLLIATAYLLVAPALAHAALEIPTWSKVTANDGRRIASDQSRVTVQATSVVSGLESNPTRRVSVRIPPSGTGTRTVSWVLQGRDPVIDSNRPFPLARGVTTLRFQLVQRARTWRIYDSDFDNYVNICINGSEDTYASGGRLYCEVRYPQKVRVIQRSRIQNLPRPKLVSEQDAGLINPICTPGQTRSSISALSGSITTETCTDGISSYGANYSRVQRRYSATVRVPRRDGRMRSVSSTVIDTRGKGPDWVTSAVQPRCTNGGFYPNYVFVSAGTTRRIKEDKHWVTSTCTQSGESASWVETSREDLPAPSMSLTSMRSEFVQYLGTKWLFDGTVTNHYGKSCWIEVWGKSSNGSWYEIGWLSASAGQTAEWNDYITWWVSDQGTPTGEFEVRTLSFLC